MAYQLVDDNEVDTEPVTLIEQKYYSKIDQDYAIDDDEIEGFITAARIILEQQLNIGMVRRQVELQWNGVAMLLPLSPTGDVESVTADDKALEASEYSVDKRQAKTISINAIASRSGMRFFYNSDGTVEITTTGQGCNDVLYKATYATGYEVLPANLKKAIMAQCDYMLKQRGMPDTNVISSTAIRLAKGYSRNLVL